MSQNIGRDAEEQVRKKSAQDAWELVYREVSSIMTNNGLDPQSRLSAASILLSMSMAQGSSGSNYSYPPQAALSYDKLGPGLILQLQGHRLITIPEARALLNKTGLFPEPLEAKTVDELFSLPGASLLAAAAGMPNQFSQP